MVVSLCAPVGPRGRPSPFFAAAWVLFPLDRLARRRRVRYQFMVVDYFSLVLLIQLPLAAKHAIFATESPSWSAGSYWGFDVFLCLASGLIWWTGVRTFAQAGIRDTRARAILGLVIRTSRLFWCTDRPGPGVDDRLASSKRTVGSARIDFDLDQHDLLRAIHSPPGRRPTPRRRRRIRYLVTC